jgi:hypothetical protein
MFIKPPFRDDWFYEHTAPFPDKEKSEKILTPIKGQRAAMRARER